MDNLESVSMDSQLAKCQPVSIDKTSQNAEYVQEIGFISSKNGVNSRSTTVEKIPSDKKCDTIDWQNFLYSNFEYRSTEQQQNEIEDVESSFEQNGEKNNTVSVQQAVLTCNKGNDEQESTGSVGFKHAVKRNQHRHCCEHCDKKFSNKQRLAVHRAKIHGVMDSIFHSCSVCGKSFSSSSELENHESIHRNDLSTKCVQCDKMFKTARSMRYHLNNYCLNKPNLYERKEFKNQEPEDFQIIEKLKIEPSQEQVYLAERTDALLESIVKEEIHIKDELIEFDASENDSVNRETVEADIGDQDCRNDIAVDVKNQITVSPNPEAVPPKSQSKKQKQRAHDTNKSVLKKKYKYNRCDICGKTFNYWPRLIFHRVKVHGIEDKDSPISHCLCNICGKVYFNQDDLERHRSSHKNTNERDFTHQCSYCNRSFVNKYHKTSHEQTHTKNYRYKCRFCGKGSSSRSIISFHEAQKHNHVSEEPTFYRCSVCYKDFASQSRLTIHESSHRTEYSIKCENCDKMFKSDRQMKIHLRFCRLATSGNRTKKRSEKEKTTDFLNPGKPQTDLLQHQVNVTGKKENCLLKTLSISKMHKMNEINDHNRTENDLADRDTVKADNMHEDYSNDVAESEHELNLENCLPQPRSEVGTQNIILPKLTPSFDCKFTPNPQHKHSCVDCDKTFSRRSGLIDHRAKIHDIKENDVSSQRLSTDGERRKERKKFSCDVCDQSFVERQRLYQHRVKVHDIFDKDVSLSRCKCEICGKVYFSEDALEYHRLTHTKKNEGKFEHHCSYCDRSFALSCRKKRHELTHTKNYKFKCRFCDAGAPNKKRILYHEAQKHNVVSEELIFHLCSVCGRKCISAAALAVHESIHSNDLPVKCEQCDLRFKHVINMKQHLLFEHLNKLRVYERRGTKQKKATDLQLTEKSQKEPMKNTAERPVVISESDSTV